jgi:hypothetical protein
MKKKIFWLAALFAALALVFTGCGGGDGDEPGDDPPDAELVALFSRIEYDGTGAKIKISGKTVIATKGSGAEMNVDLLTKEGGYDASEYKGIKFQYKTTKQANGGLQDGVNANNMWIITGWGAFTEDEWTDVECIFATGLIKGWQAESPETAFDKSEFEKLWFGLGTDVDNTTKFEMRNFEFIK